MRHFLVRLLPSIPVICLLTACGAGGGSGGGAGVPPAGEHPLGTLAMEQGSVTVTATTPLVAGSPATFRLGLRGMSEVATVEAWIGRDYDTLTSAAVTSQRAPGDWEAAVTLPDPIPPSTRLLVRITGSEGNVLESGTADFAIP